jgi:hypothetical protein
MKKIIVILLVFISFFVCVFYLAGLEKRFDYVEDETNIGDVQLIKNENFSLSIGLGTYKDKTNVKADNFGVSLVFGKPKKSVIIKSVELNFNNKLKFPLESLAATDGFYSWKEERNIKVKSFQDLPEKFKTVDESNKAYFVYFWKYIAKESNCKNIELNYDIELIVSGKEFKIQGKRKFKIISETIFVNPIRFH